VAKDYPDLASFPQQLPCQGEEGDQNPLAFFTHLAVMQRSLLQAELSTFYLLSKTTTLQNSHAESGLSPKNK